MKRRALSSATADLFAGAAPAPRPAPAPAPAPTPAIAVPPPPGRSSARAHARHLWYAVVFQASAGPPNPSLERLSLHALRFTPRVSIERPDALLLEIRGSIKLFGSLDALHAKLDAVWSALKLCASSSTAPSTLGALWLARAGERVRLDDPGPLAGALAGLPVACLGWESARLHTLRTLGVDRIGELMRLPRDGIARRFGAAALAELDVALAHQAAPRRAFVPRGRFRARCDFDVEVETAAYVGKALEPLLERCARFLCERQAGVQTLELALEHRAHPVTRVTLGLAGVTGDVRRLKDVSTHKLARLALAAPVLSLELRSGPLQPLAAGSPDLFAAGAGGAAGRDGVPQLVERLRARLGEEAVYGICPVAEHRPEASWQRVGALPARDAHRAPPARHADVLKMPRPVWLLHEPERLRAPDVERLHGGRTQLEGPERIESGWWDGKDVARDYYIVREACGIRLWVFQERRSRRWYVHGVFA